jgi:hypothetical protein
MQPTHEQIVGQLDRIEQLIHDHMHDSAVWRVKTEAELHRNTEATEAIRRDTADAVQATTAVASLRKLVIWLGSLAAGIFGLWQLWQALHPGIHP